MERFLVNEIGNGCQVIFDKLEKKTFLSTQPIEDFSIFEKEKDYFNLKLNLNEEEISKLQPVLSTVVINTTEACNLRCKYCVRYQKDYASIHMPEYLMLRILRESASFSRVHGVKVVVQFHGGEPTLRLEVIQNALEKMDKNELQYLDLRIQTNGTNVDNRFIKLCQKFDIHVGLSFDGPKGITDNVRVALDGKSVTDRIEKAIELIKQNISRKQLSCLCVLSMENVDQADEVFDYMIQHGIDDFSVLPLYPDYSNCIQDCKQIVPREEMMYEFSKKIFDHWINRLKQGYKLCIPSFQIFIWNFLASNSGNPLANTPCGQAQTMVFVESDGEVYGCGPFSRSKANSFGNILNNSLEEIVNDSEKYKLFANRSTASVKECSICALQEICRGGCPANSLLQKETIYAKDPFCDYWKKLIGHIMRHVVLEPEIVDLIPDYTIRL